MAKTISKDTPLAEITLRRYEKPGDISGRELVRKICLSLGIIHQWKTLRYMRVVAKQVNFFPTTHKSFPG